MQDVDEGATIRTLTNLHTVAQTSGPDAQHYFWHHTFLDAACNAFSCGDKDKITALSSLPKKLHCPDPTRKEVTAQCLFPAAESGNLEHYLVFANDQQLPVGSALQLIEHPKDRLVTTMMQLAKNRDKRALNEFKDLCSGPLLGLNMDYYNSILSEAQDRILQKGLRPSTPKAANACNVPTHA